MVEENYQHICNHPPVSGDLEGMVEQFARFWCSWLHSVGTKSCLS